MDKVSKCCNWRQRQVGAFPAPSGLTIVVVVVEDDGQASVYRVPVLAMGVFEEHLISASSYEFVQECNRCGREDKPGEQQVTMLVSNTGNGAIASLASADDEWNVANCLILDYGIAPDPPEPSQGRIQAAVREVQAQQAKLTARVGA